ncbi:aspartate 1-decarboxylase [Betaproteobacteria bacterium]|nr:aspartate 1-decarboxylase [Betaproteobacteria bacterium]
MLNVILKGKLHRVTVTGNDLHYEGSVAIDSSLLELAGIHEFEKVEIYNINTGERFETYAIASKAGSGVVALNGAAARKAMAGDLLIVCSYVLLTSDELRTYKPNIIKVDGDNKPLK